MSPQAIAVMIFMSIMAAGAGVIFGLFPGMKNDNALDELVVLAAAASQSSFHLGKGAITNFKVIVDNGFLDDKIYEDGVGENKYGKNATANSSVSNGVVTMTYVTNTAKECKYILSKVRNRVDNFYGSGPTCSSTTLTMQVTPRA